MRRSPTPLALLALLSFLAASPAQAQAGPVANVAQDTLDQAGEAVDGVVDGVGEAGEKVGDAVTGAGRGIGDAAGAVGRAVADAVRFAGQAALRLADGLGVVGLAASATLARGAIAAVAQGAGILAALGASAGLLAAVAGSAIASAAATGRLAADLWAAAWAALRLLRPATVPEPVFAAVAGTGAAASAGVAGYGLLSLLRRYGLLGFAGLAGFTRIADDELLRHPLRSQVFQAIQHNPGIHASELARQTGVGWGTITHHLEKLERAELVTTRKVNNQKCFFENGGRVSRHDMAVASAVRAGTASQIASYVTSHPMTSQKAMAEAIGVSPALASFHVKKLTNLGVLDKMRRGKETLLTTSEALRRILAAPEATVLAVERDAGVRLGA